MRNFLASVVIVWFAGFVLFSLTLPGPLQGPQGEAAIVPTGAAGRIDRGLQLLDEGAVKAMLVTGVDRAVTASEFARQFGVSDERMMCCVSLGFTAVDTRTNAAETADWVAERGIHSIRLVTTDWHMRRAAGELRRVLPPDITVYEDAVVSQPSLRILFVEYHKLLASWIAGLFERQQ